MEWISVEDKEAPKGNYSLRITDAEYVVPPKILLLFECGSVSVAHWDYYYDTMGAGFEGIDAWVEPVSGELIVLHYDEPTHWQPLTPPPEA